MPGNPGVKGEGWKVGDVGDVFGDDRALGKDASLGLLPLRWVPAESSSA